MLKIIVEHLNDGPLVLAVDAPPEEFELKDELFAFEGRVEGELTFKLIGHDVEGRGELRARCTTPCVRCLKPLHLDLRVPIDEMWLWRSPHDQKDDRQPSPEDIGAEYYEGEQIALNEPLRELIMAELPAYPLCQDDCKGLCAGCGANLNEEPCRCAPKPEAEPEPPVGANEKWKAALRGIRPNLEN